MRDWQLIQSYWLHFYKFQSTQPNLFCQILQEEEIDLNHDEEKASGEKIEEVKQCKQKDMQEM